MIIAGMAFIVVNFFVKLLGAQTPHPWFGSLQHYPAHELILARSVVSFVISYYIIKKRGLTLLGNNKKWLLIRGGAGMIALTLFFYTILHLPLVVASILQYLSPIFTVIFALILLKERIKILQWFFIAMAFSGVVVIGYDKLINPELGEQIALFQIGLAILSAAFSGIAYVAIIKLKSTDTPINIVIYFPMISIPVMVFLCLFEFTMPNGIEWLILLIIGIFTQIAQVMMTKAFHEGPTAVVAPFQYLGAIYAFLIGLFIFDEKLSFVVYIGTGLILIGVVFNSLLRKH